MSSFCLVFAVPDDAPALLNIYAPYVRTTAVSFECEPPTEREFAGRIASIGAFYPYLAAREGGRNGAIVGYAYASRAQERAAYRKERRYRRLCLCIPRSGTGRLPEGTALS